MVKGKNWLKRHWLDFFWFNFQNENQDAVMNKK